MINCINFIFFQLITHNVLNSQQYVLAHVCCRKHIRATEQMKQIWLQNSDPLQLQ